MGDSVARAFGVTDPALQLYVPGLRATTPKKLVE
jgi:hypothetical protein